MKILCLLLLAMQCMLAVAADTACRSTTGPAAAWRSRSGEAYLIETSHDLERGSGTLRRRGMTVSPSGQVQAAATPSWNAEARLPPADARKIFTLAPHSGATVAFTWETLPETSRLLLNADARGEMRVNWLRGDQRHELGQPEGVFRKRDVILGDIDHSVPLIVGPPSAARTGQGYAGFRQAMLERPPVVYVGANDGMLHAFDARDGTELFAYIPAALMGVIGQLGNPAYRHRAFMDGSPGYGEALVQGQWKSVLASGMGTGGRGVIALDVTDPLTFPQNSGALWEFTEQDDPMMGNVSAAPIVARIKAGTSRSPSYRYVVLAPSSSAAALFLLALDKPAGSAWRAGSNYDRLVAPPDDAAQANALAMPGLALNADASVRYAYAGDAHGNLWRFDFTGKPPWPAPRLMFTARDGQGVRQPIRHAPAVAFAPGGGYMVLFGTEGAGPQSFYGIHDALADAEPPLRRALAVRTLAGTGSYAVSGEAADLGGPAAKRGWFIDFPAGEHAAGAPAIVAGAVVFDTHQQRADRCSVDSRSYVLDTLGGLAYNSTGAMQSGASTAVLGRSNVGTPPLLIAAGTISGERSATGSALATRSIVILRPQEGGALAQQRISIVFKAKRLGWREVNNWQDLHDATR